MTHQEALKWLFGLQLFGVKLGLENIRALLTGLGEPQRAFPAMLITGTNGKGSVAAMCTAVLRAKGLRVGTYTSPHLVRFAERIAIDGEAIPARRLAALATQSREAISRLLTDGGLHRHPTFFEVATAMAFCEFARARVDIAVVEVGLGGRFDATNALEPEVSVLTSVALEHTRWLGTTVERIAFEKSGIARAGKPFVCGIAGGGALRVVRERVRAAGAHLVLARRAVHTEVIAASRRGLVLTARSAHAKAAWPRLHLPLPGRHQQDNVRVALAALAALPPALRPDARATRRGLRETRWPGRLEQVAGHPRLLLDGAHNPHAARALASYLREFERGTRIVMVFACLGDKDVRGITRQLFPLAAAVVATGLSNPRALATSELAAIAPRRTRVVAEPDAARALVRARELAGPRGLLLVTGSLYLVGEVKALLAGCAAPDQG